MAKVQVVLTDTTVDTLGMMLVGFVLNMPKDQVNYHEKVGCVVEYLEEVMEPQYPFIAVYIRVLELMPATVKRQMPPRIYEFLKAHLDQIEEEYGGPIPERYRPKYIKEPAKPGLVDASGNELTKSENLADVLEGPKPKIHLVGE